MNVNYIRVSSVSQNEQRQIESMVHIKIDKTFVDKTSGKNIDNRPELQNMLAFIRESDTVYVHSFDRLARSTADLLAILKIIDEKKCKLVSIKENLDTSLPHGRLMLTMLGAIAEFELTIIRERQREGIQIAKEEGKYKGRKVKFIPDIEHHYFRYTTRQISKAALAKELNISRPTLDRLFTEFLKQHNSLKSLNN